jgi:hypothetical protein
MTVSFEELCFLLILLLLLDARLIVRGHFGDLFINQDGLDGHEQLAIPFDPQPPFTCMPRHDAQCPS